MNRSRPDLAERNRRNAVHGLNGSPTWKSWCAMCQRISNPRSKDYPNYGGRGLDMDPNWRSFQSFLNDMGLKPEGRTLGRIDNEKGYWPSNCRWETHSQQCNNKRTSIPITVNGKTQTIAQWAKEIGCTRQALRYRLRAGWTPEQIVNTEIQAKRRVACH